MNKYACIVLSLLIISLMTFFSILTIQVNRTHRVAFEKGYERNYYHASGWFKIKN